MAGWTNTNACLQRGHNHRKHSQSRRSVGEKAPVGTSEDAHLVAQGKKLEEELSALEQR